MVRYWQDAPSLRELHALLPAARHRTRPRFAAGLLIAALMLWIGVWAGAVWVNSLWLKVLLATLSGVATGVLFVLGHDACHGAFTGSARFDRFAARLAFLPALHSATAWDWGHNRMHHSWTNLRTKDPGYAPLTLAEWRALHPLGKLLRRSYFTLPGMGFYYLIEVWWRSLTWLNANERAQLRSQRAFIGEIAGCVGFLATQIAIIVYFGAWRSSGDWRIAAEIWLCVVWPFLVWNWVMAFVTIQHHTHPRVVWFDDEKRWSVFQSQVGGTVHLKLPRLLEVTFAHIFEHTAHHVDKRIPLYGLAPVQRALEVHFADAVIVQVGSLTHLRDVLRSCRLYDYDAQTWHDFDGRQTG